MDGDDWITVFCDVFTVFTWAVHLAEIIDVTRSIRWAPRSSWGTASLNLTSFVTTCAITSENSVGFKPQQILLHPMALHYESAGNSACITDFIKKWRSSSNETVVYSRTPGESCAPQHLPSSQKPCASLTDRQLCKREELKVALSPEPPEIHPDTPSSGVDRWPSCLLIIKASICNIKNGPLLLFREHRYVDTL